MVDLWPEDPDLAEHRRRSLYLCRKRNVRYPLFDAFDAPDTQSACPRRETSTHALQALVPLLEEKQVPVIGHCLGGQMLARALGGSVSRNPVKEIGWVPVEVEDSPLADAWFGDKLDRFCSFQWHEDTFTIPPGGGRILAGKTCPNQAYVVDARHLGMQCHVEVNAEMIETWCRIGITDIDENIGKSPAVQDAVTIRSLIPENLPQLTATATRLYARWIEGLKG